MRLVLVCAAAGLIGGLLSAGCTNPPGAPIDSKSESKHDDTSAATNRGETQPAKSTQPAEPWGNIIGRVIWREDKLPNLPALVPTMDVAHCSSRGPIPDETWVINNENKGVKYVFVWLVDPADLTKELPIHPSLKEVETKTVVMDQPCCRFEPRCVALREGQTLMAKNPSPVAHNFNYAGGDDNPGANQLVPAGGDYQVKLVASTRPIAVSCGIHPWMKGWIRVFGHPYFALTDDNGKFEIKKAPAGRYNLVVWHEEGWLNGDKRGKPIDIPAGGVIEVNVSAPRRE